MNINQFIKKIDSEKSNTLDLPLIEQMIEYAREINFFSRKEDGKKFINKFFELILCIQEYSTSEIGDFETLVFSKENSTQNRCFFAACLLLCYHSNENSMLFLPEIKYRFLDLVEQSYGEKNWLKTAFSQKKYSRDQILQQIKEQFRLSYNDTMGSIIGISSIAYINRYEQNFRKTINSLFFKDVLANFIPLEVIRKKSLEAIFGKIKTYNEENGKGKIEAYRTALNELEMYREIAQEFNTEVSNLLIVGSLKQLENILTEDYNKSPIGKPVNFFITEIKKKYPLHEIGRELRFSIGLRKEGLGYATQLNAEIKSNCKFLIFKNRKLEFIDFEDEFIKLVFEAELSTPVNNLELEVNLIWENTDESIADYKAILNVLGQRKDIDWEDLKYEDPYDSEPVDNEDHLVGRDEILKRLYAKTTGKKVSSAFIYGQKRVGKTSIAKTLMNKIKKNQKNFITIYKETGDYQTTSSELSETINELGTIICKEIVSSAPDIFNSLEIPDFNGSFNRLSSFLDLVYNRAPQFRILILLDEFDEIDPQLYLKGKTGDAFFLTIRAISNKNNVGFVLIGGEKMKIILSAQGEQINKFVTQKVDYFEREDYLNEYAQLVRNPVPVFEFEKESIEQLFSYTFGNPFFTKTICEQIFKNCIDQKDCHITEAETIEAIYQSLAQADSNSFSHFWEDGIKEKGEKEEIIVMNRKKFLLGYAKLLSKNKVPTKSTIWDSAKLKGLDESETINILNEFIDRSIIKEDGDSYKIMVKYFEKWLISFGEQSIVTTFSDEERIIQYKKLEEEASIKTKEIQELITDWPSYQGNKITVEILRDWLNQIDNIFDQRMIFNLLFKIDFFNDNRIRDILENLHKRVQNQINRSIDRSDLKNARIVDSSKSGKQLKRIKRRNFIITYLDGLSKSGAEYTKKYADKNNIHSDCIIPPGRIIDFLKKSEERIIAIIFVDDFLGTGNSISENLNSFLSDYSSELLKHELSYHICVITGFLEGKNKIEETLNNFDFEVDLYIHLGDVLGNSDKAFSDDSHFFNDYLKRNKTQKIAKEYGSKLVPQNPLGYGDCQSLVVFPNTCPNNSLPILWKRGKNWTPLFERIL